MKKLLTLLAFVLVVFTANAQSTLKGDVNGDGEVSTTDIAMIVNHILGVADSNFIIANADVDGDGEIGINDVMGAVNNILGDNGGGIGDTSQAYLTCPDDNHPHMIDLGLPSGTLWACCNVGASKPEEYGGYYAWGETEEKDVCKLENWIFFKEIPFYYWALNDLWFNLPDDITGTQYDVAHVKWGGNWVMPSTEQYKELLYLIIYNNNYSISQAFVNGVNSVRISGKNGGSIFLPLAGYKYTVEVTDYATGTTYTENFWSVGEDGHYWLSNHDTFDDYYGEEILEDGSIGVHEGPTPILWYVWISIGDDEISAFHHDTFSEGGPWDEIRGRSVRPVWVDK